MIQSASALKNGGIGDGLHFAAFVQNHPLPAGQSAPSNHSISGKSELFEVSILV